MWETLKRESVTHQVEQQVLRVLRDEQLQPGDRLPPERDLARMLGVSRPTLREAIGSLRVKGRIEVAHGRGVFVAEPGTSRELRSALDNQEMTLTELFAMREVLEVPAAGWAAELGDKAKLKKVREAYEKLESAATASTTDYKRLQEADARFHMAIGEAAGNRFLRQTLGVLQEMVATGMETTLSVPGRLERSRAEHRQILDALESGDANTAKRTIRTHLRGAARAAQRRIEQAHLEARE